MLLNPFAGASMRQPIAINCSALFTGATIGLGPLVLKKKPGAPKKYNTEEERRAAEAAAKREKRTKKRKRRDKARLRRLIQQAAPAHEPTGSHAARLRLQQAIDEHQPEEVITELYDEVVRAEEMEEYDWQVAQQKRREQRADATTLDDLKAGAGLADGKYLTNAPQGKGLLLSENEVGDIVELSDTRQKRARGRVTPKGFGAHHHEDGDGRKDPVETDDQWARKHCHWDSVLSCYRKPCTFPVIGVLTEDIDKPVHEARYHCWLHTPLNGVSSEDVDKPVLAASKRPQRISRKRINRTRRSETSKECRGREAL